MDTTRRGAFVITAAVMAIVWVRVAAAERPDIMTWKIGDETRGALAYEPSRKAPNNKSPLVLAFHGHGDTAENYQFTDLHRSMPEAVVVYVQGSPSPRDHYPGWQTEKGQDGDRDLLLVDAALVTLKKKYNIDETRIYATGLSNGAGFTFLLWAERPNVFAAFAAVAGRMRPSAQPKMPRPLLQIAGMRDETIPFSEQLATIDSAKRIDGVTGKGSSCGFECTLYAGGAAPVMTWIHPGGHVYPDGTSELIAKFFRDHALTP